MTLELYASKTCAYCDQVRERLEWDGETYVEYDVDTDAAARSRLMQLLGTAAMVPALVRDGRVVAVGEAGRGCYLGGG